MGRRYGRLTFTDRARREQARRGSRDAYRRMEEHGHDDDRLGEREIAFVRARDGFYMASAGDGGWPYVQFRGGPPGFLKVINGRTLAFADYRGNRQYITVGNVGHDPRVSLMLMDYPNRQRLKILARAELIEVGDDEELVEQVHDGEYEATVERVMLLHVEAFDWNCPQHITPRYTLGELAAATGDPG